jgi:hypothetical protein
MLGESFGRMLNTPYELPGYQSNTHKVLPQGSTDILQNVKEIRNTVNSSWRDGTSLLIVANFWFQQVQGSNP